jgi:hypothetical protein
MYYICTADLWSKWIPNRLKFSKDGVYECIAKDTFINNQMQEDDISVEKWQHYFIQIDLDEVNIEEIKEILECEKV